MNFGTGFWKHALLVIALSSFFAGGSASAQVVTGTLGQPSATTTIKGNQIPAPPPKQMPLLQPLTEYAPPGTRTMPAGDWTAGG